MTAKDNEIEFLRLRCKALEEENERLELRLYRPGLNQNVEFITFATYEQR